MRKTATLLIACILISGGLARAQAPKEVEVVSAENDAKAYGEFPIAYKEIIQRWLETKLLDAPSAIIEWADPPRAGEYKTKKGERYKGYIVDFKVNSRNQFGSYTGKQKYRVVLRNGDVLWGGRPL